MIKTIKHYTSVALQYINLSICSVFEYPINLSLWALANPLNYFLTLLTVQVVVAQFGTLNGWKFEEIAFLYGIGVVSHGLTILLFFQTWYIGHTLIQGEFDRFLLRPMSVLFQYTFVDFNIVGVSDMIPGIIIFVYGCTQIHFQWTLYNTIGIIAVLLGATLIRGSLYLITGTFAFWSRSNNNSMMDFSRSFLDLTTNYPLSIYPQIVQMLFTFLLPLGFITFYPACDFLGKSNMLGFSNGLIWITVSIGILVFWLARRFFKAGLKRYESSGS